MIRHALRWLLGLFFVIAGINHFRSPAVYLSIMPPYLPWHQALVDISGWAEIVGGLGVLFRPTRRAAAWGLIALLIAIFPANIHAALHGMRIGGQPVAPWVLWLRLPFQLVFLAWVYWTCLAGTRETGLKNTETLPR